MAQLLNLLSLEPKCNSALAEVVRCHLNIDTVTGKNPDTVFTHLTAGMGKHFMIIVELDPKHSVWQQLRYRSRELNYAFLGHVILSICSIGAIDMRKFV